MDSVTFDVLLFSGVSLLVLIGIFAIFKLNQISRRLDENIDSFTALYENVNFRIDALKTYIQYVNDDVPKPTDTRKFDLVDTEEVPSGTVIAIQRPQSGTYQSSTTHVTVTEPTKPKRSNAQRNKRQNTKTHDTNKLNRDKIRGPGVFTVEYDHAETSATKQSTLKRSTKSRKTSKKTKSRQENRTGLLSTDSSYTSFP